MCTSYLDAESHEATGGWGLCTTERIEHLTREDRLGIFRV